MRRKVNIQLLAKLAGKGGLCWFAQMNASAGELIVGDSLILQDEESAVIHNDGRNAVVERAFGGFEGKIHRITSLHAMKKV